MSGIAAPAPASRSILWTMVNVALSLVARAAANSSARRAQRRLADASVIMGA